MDAQPRYWVECHRTPKRRNINGYAVIDGQKKAPVENGVFLNLKHGGWEVALHLANTMRDDLNKSIK